MPTFDFSCQKCGNVFEFARPFGSKIVPACPRCGAKKTEKLLSAPAVVFKGAGWYKTDSRGASTAPKKEEKKTETKNGEASGKSESPKSDAPETADTPAPKAEKKTEKSGK